MKKYKIIVPRTIRYLTEWTDFINNIKELPCILDKSVTGCGFTEWCITNNMNIILCSPRRVLLENKENQHKDSVLYVKNDLEKPITYDKDLTKLDRFLASYSDSSDPLNVDSSKLRILQNNVIHYYNSCKSQSLPCKLLVTYDSFKLIKEALDKEINNFLVVVDEFQSIFTDSRFKPTTEIEFLYYLQGLTKIMFVSATPTTEEYLEFLNEFKNLPYYELDWKTENPLRILEPVIKSKKLYNQSIQGKITELIEEYRSGKSEEIILFDKTILKSKEAVFYVNSVKNICDVIRKANLKIEECNILCANTSSNFDKLKKAFKLTKDTEYKLEIGRVPLLNETNKMFTFCTRTVYLGADFYSTNAKTYIFSDANVDCLAVDITLDLPQIMGRQRLSCNPWKNRAELYYKLSGKDVTEEEFQKIIDMKMEDTNTNLKIYNQLSDENEKAQISINLDRITKAYNYKYNYISVNHSGKTLVPIINNLVLVSELRAFKIQKMDYKDRCSVFNAIDAITSINDEEINNILIEFNSETIFSKKMKVLVYKMFNLSEEKLKFLLNKIPLDYANYINALGINKIRSLGCRKDRLDSEMKFIYLSMSLKNTILSSFIVGNCYSTQNIKTILNNIYFSLKLVGNPKASDLLNYFELKPCKIKINDKWEHGFQIIGLKKED